MFYELFMLYNDGTNHFLMFFHNICFCFKYVKERIESKTIPSKALITSGW